jgi:hypothetical protein
MGANIASHLDISTLPVVSSITFAPHRYPSTQTGNQFNQTRTNNASTKLKNHKIKKGQAFKLAPNQKESARNGER